MMAAEPPPLRSTVNGGRRESATEAAMPAAGPLTANPTVWTPGIPKLGSTTLRSRGISMPGYQALPPTSSAPGSAVASPTDSPMSGMGGLNPLQPKPPPTALGPPPGSRGGARVPSMLGPERSPASLGELRPRSSNDAGSLWDPCDPSLPPWMPGVLERLSRLEGQGRAGSAVGGAREGLSLPESVALGSRMQALEDALRQAQKDIRLLQTTQQEQTGQLFRQARQTSNGSVGDTSVLDSRLSACEVLMSSCSARLEDHDAQVLELGHQLTLHQSQIHDCDAQVRDAIAELGKMQAAAKVADKLCKELEQKVLLFELEKKVSGDDSSSSAAAVAAAAAAAAAASAARADSDALSQAQLAQLEERVQAQEQAVQAAAAATAEVEPKVEAAHQALLLLASRMEQLSARNHGGTSPSIEFEDLQAKIQQLQNEVQKNAIKKAAERTNGRPTSSGRDALPLPPGSTPAPSALKDVEYRLNKRLNEVEAYLRKGGAAGFTPSNGSSFTSASGVTALGAIQESGDSYSAHQVVGPPGGAGGDPAAVAAAASAAAQAQKGAARAMAESAKALHEAGETAQQLNMMKAALRMLHEQVSAKSANKVDDVIAESRKALQRTEAFEVILKNFAAKLDAFSTEIKSLQVAADQAVQTATLAAVTRQAGNSGKLHPTHSSLLHTLPTQVATDQAVQTATLAAMMGQAGSINAPTPEATFSPPNGNTPVHKNVKFADPESPLQGGGGGGIDTRKLAQQQLDMLGRFQMMERDVLMTLSAYAKTSDFKEMENFMMDRQQQLQNEIDLVKLNLRDIQASVLQHNFSAGNMFGAQPMMAPGSAGNIQGSPGHLMRMAAAAGAAGMNGQQAMGAGGGGGGPALTHSTSVVVRHRAVAGHGGSPESGTRPGAGGAQGSPLKMRL